ncbi:hypothetical protein [Rubinisphaera sp. JC750]|uniref:DUF7674 family protein n=1 Tax=Rubinisphaera sp. JC750 TaxID=2898658 RepID=UPI001F3912CA|nr:hypothetical protein [Rubinisphaera sp. JC750]
MKNQTQHFCEELAARFDVLAPLMQEHISDFDEVLPHVFMADVARFVLSERLHRQEIVRVLEHNFREAAHDIQDLIAVSFVENLESREHIDRALDGVQAEALREEWDRQRK